VRGRPGHDRMVVGLTTITTDVVSSSDMETMLGDEAKLSPRDSTYTPMLINFLFDIYHQKYNIVIKFVFVPCYM
jgi:hypothetical protein